MPKKYRKGYVAELEMVHKLAEKGFMVLRTPRSGRLCLPSPDIIAAKGDKLIVIECKSHKKAFKIPKEQLNELVKWEQKTFAKAYICWKMSRKDWFFIPLNTVIKNNGNVGKKFCMEHGIKFETLFKI